MIHTKNATVALLISAALIAACRREPQPPPTPRTAAAAPASTTEAAPARDLLGKSIAVTMPLLPNAVARCAPSSSVFAPGQPIRLAFDLNESPEALHVAARIVDRDGQPVAYMNVPAARQKSVTVTVNEKLKQGSYKLEGYWGGNLVCEHEIEVKR